MITDALNTIAKGVSVAGAAGSAVIGDTIDLGVSNLPQGYDSLYLVVQVSTAILSSVGAGGLQFALITDPTALSTSSQKLLLTPVFATATSGTQLPAGDVLFICGIPRLPINRTNNDGRYKRFLGLLATITTNSVASGAINAYLTYDPPAWVATADAVN